DRLLKVLDKRRLADDLRQDDFELVKKRFAETMGPRTLGGEIGRVRAVFRYGYLSGLLDKPMRFGPQFVKPPRRLVRQARQKLGPQMFTADEIRRLLQRSENSFVLHAMILLGVNAGFGNTD